MKILGLDVSTKTGAVLLDRHGNPIYAKEWDTSEEPNKDNLERARLQANRLTKLLDKHSPDLIIFEGYGGTVYNLVPLVTIGTVLRYFIRQYGLDYYEAAPSQLKKFATGSGKGKKDQIRLGVYKHWGFEDDSDNVVDAYVLAQMGYYFSRKKGNQYQKEVLKKIFPDF